MPGPDRDEHVSGGGVKGDAAVFAAFADDVHPAGALPQGDLLPAKVDQLGHA
jgi:hypothetical protein